MSRFSNLMVVRAAGACALVIASAAGCVSGPHWRSGVSAPRPTARLDGRPLIVSGFVTSERVVSVTQSFDIQTVMESATVSDAAPEIADALGAMGLRAEARAGFGPAQLRGNELLVRGAVIAHEPYKGRRGPWLIPYFISLGLFGLWGPSPMTFDNGYKFLYRIDVIDAQGRYVLATGTRQGRIAYEQHHLFVEGDNSRLFSEMRRRVAQVLGESLRSGQASSYGPPASQ